MTILAATLFELGQVGIITQSAVSPARFTIPAHAFAFNITEVSDGGALPGFGEVHQPGLDGDTPGIGRQGLPGEASRHMATTQPRTGTITTLARFCPGLVGLPDNRVDKWLAAIFRGTGPGAEALALVAAAPAHEEPPARSSNLERK